MRYTQNEIRFVLSFLKNRVCNRNELSEYSIVCVTACPIYQLSNPSCRIVLSLERAKFIVSLLSKEELFEAML